MLATASARVHPCQIHKAHAPNPLRTVQHHVWPEGDGGPTVAGNLVWVCDTGHYNVHEYLDILRRGEELPMSGNHKEKNLARLGWDRMKRQAVV